MVLYLDPFLPPSFSSLSVLSFNTFLQAWTRGSLRLSLAKERAIIKELNWTAFPSFSLLTILSPLLTWLVTPYKSIQYSVPTIDILPKGIETPPVAISRVCFHLRTTSAFLTITFTITIIILFFPFGREHKIVSSHRYPILRLTCHRYSSPFFLFWSLLAAAVQSELSWTS